MNTHEQIWPWDVLDKKIKKARCLMQNHMQKTKKQILVGAVSGSHAIRGYKMEAPGTREPSQKNSFKFRRLLSEFRRAGKTKQKQWQGRT